VLNARKLGLRLSHLNAHAASGDARGVSDLVPFSVTVGMTSKFAVPGELRKIGGTAYLLIAPRRRSFRG
jgi:hypothetical protein